MKEKVETKMEKKGREKIAGTKKIAESASDSEDKKGTNEKITLKNESSVNKSNKSHEPVSVSGSARAPQKRDEKNREEQIKSGAPSKGCDDKNCHVHGNLKARGKIFEGKVIKKFPKRVVIEFERMKYIRKYERYAKSKTKIHTRLPDCMKDEISVGDLIKVQECRPLSKIIHFVVVGKGK